MLSVLIPIYNYKITALVSALAEQVDRQTSEIEIVCFDDGSTEEYLRANESISKLPHVRYEELPINIGRAAIRNRLAAAANYDNILFLDCDSGVISDDFLAIYLKSKDQQIVVGGRVYSDDQPSNPKQLLHWKYGKTNESRPLSERQARPYIYFHSNNFMIKKRLFLETKFDEKMKGYGYEDLLFANSLKAKGIEIRHIDNSVQHLDVEDNTAFLTKTKNAVTNLRALNDNGVHMESKLELAAQKIQRFGLSSLFSSYYRLRNETIMNNLNSARPKLRFLAYYKLYYYLM